MQVHNGVRKYLPAVHLGSTKKLETSLPLKSIVVSDSSSIIIVLQHLLDMEAMPMACNQQHQHPLHGTKKRQSYFKAHPSAAHRHAPVLRKASQGCSVCPQVCPWGWLGIPLPPPRAVSAAVTFIWHLQVCPDARFRAVELRSPLPSQPR